VKRVPVKGGPQCFTTCIPTIVTVLLSLPISVILVKALSVGTACTEERIFSKAGALEPPARKSEFNWSSSCVLSFSPIDAAQPTLPEVGAKGVIDSTLAGLLAELPSTVLPGRGAEYLVTGGVVAACEEGPGFAELDVGDIDGAT
jgi:hypothetical protein